MQVLRSIPSFAFLGSLVGALTGCPIWSDNDDDGCYDCCYGDCCYGECEDPTCTAPSDCQQGFVCGADNVCHGSGTCEVWGCPSGYTCDVDLLCVEDFNQGGSGGGGGGGGGEGGAGGGPTSVYCGNPRDCSDSEFCAPDTTCKVGDCSVEGCIDGFFCNTSALTPFCDRENPGGCGQDSDCSVLGSGFRCVSGACTAPAQLCYDRTQCAAGQVCADGKCTLSCADGLTCPTEYACTATVEICTTPTVACSITNDCGSADLVCVEGACVPRAISGACGTDLVWVDNGCVPNQSRIATCQIDGTQDSCGAGNICLNQTCYTSCDVPNTTACDGAPEFNQCKGVTTAFSGPHPVCGALDNLGAFCDFSRELDCADPVDTCIDGFCVGGIAK